MRNHASKSYATFVRLSAFNWDKPILPPREPVDLVLENESGGLTGKALIYGVTAICNAVTGVAQRLEYDAVFTTDGLGVNGIAEAVVGSAITRQDVDFRSGDDASVALTGPTIPAIAGAMAVQLRYERKISPTPFAGVDQIRFLASKSMNLTGRLEIEAAKPRILDRTVATLTVTFVSGQTWAQKIVLHESSQGTSLLTGSPQVHSYQFAAAAETSSDDIT